MTTLDIDTPSGTARAHLTRPVAPSRGSLVLGHGAGGGIGTPDLELLTRLAEEGWTVVRVEQPWRVAGRRVATPPPSLDAAWLAVLAELDGDTTPPPRPLVTGGRSAGARVACRTAAAVGADAVLALSFPLHPPGRPERSRAGEAGLVTEAGRPLLVIQGERDPFGTPVQLRAELDPRAVVVEAPGAHSFARSPTAVLDHAREWLATL